MDTSVAAEGGPPRNHPRSTAHFIYTRRGCCTFPLNLITDTLFSPFPYFYLSFLYWGSIQEMISQRERELKHAQAGLLHWLWAISFLLKK